MWEVRRPRPEVLHAEQMTDGIQALTAGSASDNSLGRLCPELAEHSIPDRPRDQNVRPSLQGGPKTRPQTHDHNSVNF